MLFGFPVRRPPKHQAWPFHAPSRDYQTSCCLRALGRETYSSNRWKNWQSEMFTVHSGLYTSNNLGTPFQGLFGISRSLNACSLAFSPRSVHIARTITCFPEIKLSDIVLYSVRQLYIIRVRTLSSLTSKSLKQNPGVGTNLQVRESIGIILISRRCRKPRSRALACSMKSL